MLPAVFAQLLGVVASWAAAILDYLWHDKRTTLFKRVRRLLLLVIFPALFIGSAYATWNSAKEADAAQKELKEALARLEEHANAAKRFAELRAELEKQRFAQLNRPYLEPQLRFERPDASGRHPYHFVVTNRGSVLAKTLAHAMSGPGMFGLEPEVARTTELVPGGVMTAHGDMFGIPDPRSGAVQFKIVITYSAAVDGVARHYRSAANFVLNELPSPGVPLFPESITHEESRMPIHDEFRALGANTALDGPTGTAYFVFYESLTNRTEPTLFMSTARFGLAFEPGSRTMVLQEGKGDGGVIELRQPIVQPRELHVVSVRWTASQLDLFVDGKESSAKR